MPHSTVILLIEDSEEDFQTVRRLLSKVTDRAIEHCTDAPSAISYLHQVTGESEAPKRAWPCVILLDLNIPGEDGRSLLKRFKQHEKLRRIPIVVLTTSANPKDVEYCYEHGAAGYIVKPVDLKRFREALEMMASYWLRAVALPAPARMTL